MPQPKKCRYLRADQETHRVSPPGQRPRPDRDRLPKRTEDQRPPWAGPAQAGAFGALAGNAQDEADRRDHLARQVAYERAARERRSYLMGNRDVLHMVSSGCSDKLVCETIRDRGGQFDLSPESVVQLHQYGVSDSVIASMRKYNATR